MLANQFRGLLVVLLSAIACFSFGSFAVEFMKDTTIVSPSILAETGSLAGILPIAAIALAGTFIPLSASMTSRTVQIACILSGLIGFWIHR